MKKTILIIGILIVVGIVGYYFYNSSKYDTYSVGNVDVNVPKGTQKEVDIEIDNMAEVVNEISTFRYSFENVVEVDMDFYVGHADASSIDDWERDCLIIPYCRSYDSKDEIKDKYDEHYVYTYSGMTWDVVRSKNSLTLLYFPYTQGAEDMGEEIREQIIASLKFK